MADRQREIVSQSLVFLTNPINHLACACYYGKRLVVPDPGMYATKIRSRATTLKIKEPPAHWITGRLTFDSVQSAPLVRVLTP